MTPYVGGHGWLGVRMDSDVDWREVAELCADAYRVVAPKRLASCSTSAMADKDDGPELGPAGSSSQPEPGAFERAGSDVQGADADLLDRLFGEELPERPIDLTGLRLVQ